MVDRPGSPSSLRPTRYRDALSPPALMLWFVLVFLAASYGGVQLLISLKIGVVVVFVVGAAIVANRGCPWTPTHTGMVLFLLLAATSITYASNHHAVWRATITYFGFIVVAVALAWIMATPKGARHLMTVWVLTLGYVSAFAILHGGRGPGGHTGDQNDAAVVAAMGLSFALFGVGSADPKVRRISIILCAVFLAASIATLSRGGMIAMVSVALFYFLVTSHKFKKLIVIAIVIFGTFSFAPDQYFSEMNSIDDDVKSDSQYSTVQIRLFMWATAINAFEDNPILGVGAANYTWVVGRYQPTKGNWPGSFFRRSRTGQAAHSWYFQILSEHGLVGVTVFGFLIFRFFTGLRRIAKQSVMAENRADDVWRFLSPQLLALALMGSMIGFLSAGVFLSILTYPHFYYLIGMGAGLELAVANREQDSQSGGEKLVSDRSASNGVDIQ